MLAWPDASANAWVAENSGGGAATSPVYTMTSGMGVPAARFTAGDHCLVVQGTGALSILRNKPGSTSFIVAINRFWSARIT